MTAIVTVYTPTSITMASDSLMILGTAENPIGTCTIEKLYYFHELNICISAFGDGRLNGLFIGDIVSKFITSTTTSDIAQVAHLFEDHMREKHTEFNTLFHICGYKKSEPYVYELDNIEKKPLRRVNVTSENEVKYSILGQFLPETIESIISLMPNFNTITEEDVDILIKYAFENEIKYQETKHTSSGRTIDVGYPIKSVRLLPR